MFISIKSIFNISNIYNLIGDGVLPLQVLSEVISPQVSKPPETPSTDAVPMITMIFSCSSVSWEEVEPPPVLTAFL